MPHVRTPDGRRLDPRFEQSDLEILSFKIVVDAEISLSI